jgi:hypothetical protein
VRGVGGYCERNYLYRPGQPVRRKARRYY